MYFCVIFLFYYHDFQMRSAVNYTFVCQSKWRSFASMNVFILVIDQIRLTPRNLTLTINERITWQGGRGQSLYKSNRMSVCVFCKISMTAEPICFSFTVIIRKVHFGVGTKTYNTLPHTFFFQIQIRSGGSVLSPFLIMPLEASRCISFGHR